MQPGERSIFERGCLRAGEEWLELNLVPVAGAVVCTMVLQVSCLHSKIRKTKEFRLSMNFRVLTSTFVNV